MTAAFTDFCPNDVLEHKSDLRFGELDVFLELSCSRQGIIVKARYPAMAHSWPSGRRRTPPMSAFPLTPPAAAPGRIQAVVGSAAHHTLYPAGRGQGPRREYGLSADDDLPGGDALEERLQPLVLQVLEVARGDQADGDIGKRVDQELRLERLAPG